MRILITGNEGYIGSALAPYLHEQGHEIIGLDSGILNTIQSHQNTQRIIHTIYKDFRDVSVQDLCGFDAIVHLAGLSNDALGYCNPIATQDINCRATIELARKARAAGVKKFLFSSSCGVYGKTDAEYVDENTRVYPQTPYSKSKYNAEKGLLSLSNNSFLPLILRNATIFGVASNFRLDLLFHKLIASAFFFRKITVYGDGLDWRPFIHIRDVSKIFRSLLELPNNVLEHQTYNIVLNEQNFSIKNLAVRIQKYFQYSIIEYVDDPFPDRRSYRVVSTRLPALGLLSANTIDLGIHEIASFIKERQLSQSDFTSEKFDREKLYRHALSHGFLNSRYKPTRKMSSMIILPIKNAWHSEKVLTIEGE